MKTDLPIQRARAALAAAFMILLLAASPLEAQPPAGYYNTVDATSSAALRATLHDVIDDHTRFPYSDDITSDTWDIVNLADEDPNNSGNIVDLYKNASYAKIAGGSGAYNREHSWPKSYGFPLEDVDNYPFTDTHQLFACDSSYNSSRSNKPFRLCNASCLEKPTDFTDGRGGGTGVYPGNSNWTSGSYTQGTWETWDGRKGDVARAMFYMDIRYEGGTHGVTGSDEPDLILTDNESLIDSRNTGNNEPVAYMGMLSVLLDWHDQDPPDSREQWRNEIVFSFQGNRNPFIDHPEWAECLFNGVCETGTTGGVVLSEVLYDVSGNDDGFEWVELYNPGSSTVNLSSYCLGNGGDDYTYSMAQLSGSIAADATFVIGGPSSSSTNANPTFDQVLNFDPDFQNSGNTGDGVALFDVPCSQVGGSTVPVDAVIYGPNNNNGLIDETGSANAPEVGDAGVGSSIERVTLAGAWQIQGDPTPNSTHLAQQPECTVDADCDDGAWCNGDETCDGGICVAGTPPACNDGQFCNGTETCNETTDSCDEGAAPCDPGTETCNETTDSCDSIGSSGDVRLSEVLYDVPGTDDGLEWVELFNNSEEPVDLSGYSLGNGGEDYTYSLAQLSGTIPPCSTFVVGGPISSPTNANPVFDQVLDFDPDFQNSGTAGDGVALFDVPATQVTASTVPIDAVIYGPDNENGLIDETGTIQPPDVGDAESGSSIERVDLAGSWRIQSSPTPNDRPFVCDDFCVPSATRLCLPANNRFAVSVSYQTVQGGGRVGDAQAIPLDSLGTSAGGLFYFTNPTDPQFLVKVIDGCPVNDRWWVFYAATTNVGFELTVTDTEIPLIPGVNPKIYTNPDVNAAAPVQDTEAFATCH